MPKEMIFDQDSIVCVSENAGDIIYTQPRMKLPAGGLKDEY